LWIPENRTSLSSSGSLVILTVVRNILAVVIVVVLFAAVVAVFDGRLFSSKARRKQALRRGQLLLLQPSNSAIVVSVESNSLSTLQRALPLFVLNFLLDGMLSGPLTRSDVLIRDKKSNEVCVAR